MIAIIYGQTIARGKGVINLATHLGFTYQLNTDPDSHAVTGVTLIKRHERNPLYSPVFYDKRERVAQMHQGKTLTVEENQAIHNHVRFDVTAHSEGIIAICKAARSKLKRIRKREPRAISGWRWADKFLTEEPRPNAWWLVRAVFVLSHFFVGDSLKRRSFAKWLLPHILGEVLRLGVISGFTSDDFNRLTTLEDKVAVAWCSS